MTQKHPIDLHSPEAARIRDEIVRNTFTTEGTMVAFPLCFPGCSTPVPADESHVTALAAAADGTIYGGTSGRRVHLFVASFRGARGAVFDLGVVPGATRCVAVCLAGKNLFACVNTEDGGRIFRTARYVLPSDLIQEWGFRRPEIVDLGEAGTGEIIHAVADADRESVFVATERRLIRVHAESAQMVAVAEAHTSGEMAFADDGDLYGFSQGGLWRYHVKSGEFVENALSLPEGDWQSSRPRWAQDATSGILYTADGNGRFFSFSPSNGGFRLEARLPLAPAGPMAVTFDSRVFGFCGLEMSKQFFFDPATKEVRNLGVAVSVIERRRYGYVFGAAVTGSEGEIVFGEDDDLGHLWLYFPRILRRECC